MKKSKPEEKLFDLLHRNLSDSEFDELNKCLSESGTSRDDFESMQLLDKLMEKSADSGPSEKMDRRFYAMLNEEQKKELMGNPEISSESSFITLFRTAGIRVAAGIALFILGWFASGWFNRGTIGHDQITGLTGEIKQLKETLVLTMMQQNSPVERIKAVNMVAELGSADDQIIAGLLRVLNQDENDNLRLLSLDALLRYSGIPEVRKGLISSIGNQTSPLVQLRLAEIMLILRERRAIPEFQKVLENESLNYNVRDKISKAVVVLL
jgi:hypothetical protein